MAGGQGSTWIRWERMCSRQWHGYTGKVPTCIVLEGWALLEQLLLLQKCQQFLSHREEARPGSTRPQLCLSVLPFPGQGFSSQGHPFQGTWHDTWAVGCGPSFRVLSWGSCGAGGSEAGTASGVCTRGWLCWEEGVGNGRAFTSLLLVCVSSGLGCMCSLRLCIQALVICE